MMYFRIAKFVKYEIGKIESETTRLNGNKL